MRSSNVIVFPGSKACVEKDENGGCNCGHSRGKLAVVGIGPGGIEYMTMRAYRVIRKADIIVGYKTYIELIKELLDDKEVLSSGMMKEIDRSRLAIEKALEGNYVAVVSSGDSGIYGMAGIVLEILEKEGLSDKIDVEIVPGVSSAFAAAASLGAPLMHDTAFISLSDLLTPREQIIKRLESAAQGDFVVALYNPVSKKRTELIKEAQQIFLKYRGPETPVGIVRNAKREGEEINRTTLGNFVNVAMDMFSMVIIGNSKTYLSGEFILTPRGYQV